MTTKKERSKLEEKFNKLYTPYDRMVKDLTLDISDLKQQIVDYEYKAKFLKEMLERKQEQKKYYEDLEKEYQNGKKV